MKNSKFLLLFPLFVFVTACGANPESGSTSGNTSREDARSITETSEALSVHSEHDFVFDSHVDPYDGLQGYDVYKCKDCDVEEYRNFTGLLGELDSSKTYSVLFIGNSYTFFNDSWEIFQDMVYECGFDVEVDNVTNGGWTLQQMADPNDTFGAKVAEKLSENEYDIVFLQEQSLTPATRPVFFYDAVRKLHDAVKVNGARDVLFETWGRKSTSPDLVTYNMTNYSMTQKLMAAYGAIGEELLIPVSHVGQAFYEVYSTHPEIELYNADMYHPSPIGSYLLSLTHFSTVFGISPMDCPYKFFEDDEEKQAILEDAVYNAVFGDSILEDEYKTSSVGVSAEIKVEDLQISNPWNIPEDSIDVIYKSNSGSWKVEKDDTTGKVSMESTAPKSSLVFDKELFKDGGTVSFTMSADGVFSGASEQGIMLGCKDTNIVYLNADDVYNIIGRSKDGTTQHTVIDKTKITNNVSNVKPENPPTMDANTDYRITLKVDPINLIYKMYINEDLAMISYAPYAIDGGYIGFNSGVNGSITVKDVVVNGKYINVLNFCNEPDDKSFSIANLEKALHVAPGSFEYNKDNDYYNVFISTDYVEGQEVEALDLYINLLKYYMTPLLKTEVVEDGGYGYNYLKDSAGNGIAAYSFTGENDKISIEFDLFVHVDYGTIDQPLDTTSAFNIIDDECNFKEFDFTKEDMIIFGNVKSVGESKTAEDGSTYFVDVVITDGSKDLFIPILNLSDGQVITELKVDDVVVVQGYGALLDGRYALIANEVEGQNVEIVNPIKLTTSLGYINVSAIQKKDTISYKSLPNTYYSNVEFYKHNLKTAKDIWDEMNCTETFAEKYIMSNDVEFSFDGVTWYDLSDNEDFIVYANIQYSIGRYRAIGNASNGNCVLNGGQFVDINADNTFDLVSTGTGRTWGALPKDIESGDPYTHIHFTYVEDIIITPNGDGNSQWSVQINNQIAGQRSTFVWDGTVDNDGNATIYYKQNNGGSYTPTEGAPSFKMKAVDGKVMMRLVVYSNQYATEEYISKGQGIITWTVYDYAADLDTANSYVVVTKVLNGFKVAPDYVNISPEVINARMNINVVSIEEHEIDN